MKNIYGVNIPQNAIEFRELGDGVDFDLETCNHDAVTDPRADELMMELRQGIEFGKTIPWAELHETFGADLDAPTLDQLWKGFGRAEISRVDFSPREMQRQLVANPRQAREISFKEVKEIFDEVGESAAMDLMGMTPAKMMTGNPKLDKGDDYKYLSIGLMLSPATLSGLTELCPFRSLQCSMMCLNDSGQGETFGGKKVFNAPQEFRKKRTLIFAKMKDIFGQLVFDAISHAIKATEKSGFNLCIRMNVLSDVAWEHQSIRYKTSGKRDAKVMTAPNVMSIPEFKDVQFYDYAKGSDRIAKMIQDRKSLPKNYSLTYSLSEVNMAFALWVLDHGGNVAIPFDTTANRTITKLSDWHKLPAWWAGYKVIDADIHDMRFLDNKFFTDPKNIDKTEIECGIEKPCSTRERRLIAANPEDEGDGEESSAYLLQEKGSLNPEIICEVRRELKCGHGLVCGLRLKGTKNKTNMRLVREVEEKNGLEFGMLTGGFVQYADQCGMLPRVEGMKVVEDQIYDPTKNITMQYEWQRQAIILSEARRIIQSHAAGFQHVARKAGGYTPYSKTVAAEVDKWVFETYSITSAEIKEKAIYIAKHLVEFEDLVIKASKFNQPQRLWTKDIEKFLVQKIGG